MFWTSKNPASHLSESVIAALSANFRRDEIHQLAGLGTLIELDAGSKLTTEDTIGREAMVIVSGTASVIRRGATIATVGAGDIVGEIALLSGARRNATVIADTTVGVYVMSSLEFASWMASCPRLENRTNASVVRRLTAA